MLKSVSEHVLVPKHELLRKDEAKTLLSQFGLDYDKLPQISMDDSMAKELNASVGDIIRIMRKSPVAGETRYYRKVV